MISLSTPWKDKAILQTVKDLEDQAKDLVISLEIHAKEAENWAADYRAAAARLRETLGKLAPKSRLQIRTPKKPGARHGQTAAKAKKTGTRGRKKASRKASSQRPPEASTDQENPMTQLTEASHPKKAGHGRQKRPPLPGSPEDRKKILEALMDPAKGIWWHPQELVDAIRLDMVVVLAILERWTADKILVREYRDPMGVRFPVYAYHKRVRS